MLSWLSILAATRKAVASTQQGLRLHPADGSRLVCRLSGTGTDTATLRLYAEQYDPQGGHGGLNELNESGPVLAPLVRAAVGLLELPERCGVDTATVVT